MLKPAALTDVLSQANTGGVHSTLLLNNDGGLLAFSGHADRGKGDSSPLDCRVTAAIASHIWETCQKNGCTPLDEEKVEFVLLDCEEGKVAIRQVSNLLLCIYAKDNVCIGMLKRKTEALGNYLEEQLSQIATT